jgi:ubiquinone/menaquinone biosynthesis C-methylase UbiE
MAESSFAPRMGSITFERAADYYDATRGFPAGHDANVAALFVEVGGLTANSRVLEVGIGTGRIALPLAPHVGSIVGVDLARPMMARLLAKRTTERIILAEGDARLLPLPSGVFDAAVVVHVFHLIPDWEQALAEIGRALRPDGVLLIGKNNNQGRETAFSTLEAAWKAVIPPEQAEHIGLRDDFALHAERLGWRVASPLRSYVYTVTDSPEAYYQRMAQRIWSRTWVLSDEEMARGLAALRKAIDESFVDPNAPIDIPVSFDLQAFRPPIFSLKH